MTIDGVSQSTGVERLVDVTATDGGIRVVIRDRNLGTELANVTVPADGLMGVLADEPKGLHTLAGTAGRTLEVEVRRNEVWLASGGPDAAVGLDDLMDAVAGALPSA